MSSIRGKKICREEEINFILFSGKKKKSKEVKENSRKEVKDFSLFLPFIHIIKIDKSIVRFGGHTL